MLKRLKLYGVILLGLLTAIPGFAQAPGGTAYSNLAPGFTLPYVTGTSTSLVASFTAGNLSIGSAPVAVVAGTVTTIASRTSCAKPAYTSCNIIWANSAGVVSNLDSTTFTPTSNALLTASAAGNSILAFVQTTATGISQITYPWLDSSFPAVSQSGAFVVSTGAITPIATAAAIGVATQTFTVTGLAAGDQVVPVSLPVPTALCPPVGFRATLLNTLAIDFFVGTAVACTPAAGTYKFLVVR